MMTVELLIPAAIILMVAVMRLIWIARRRRQLEAAISEAQARENAAPLSTAILASKRRSGANV